MNKEEYYEAKDLIKMLVRTREDFQHIRKSMDNRLARKADGSKQNTEKLSRRVFSGEDAAMLSEISVEAAKMEDTVQKKLEKALKRMPVKKYLDSVKGVGPISAGHICGAFDIYKADTVSKMWQYAGMNPGMVRGKKRVENKDGTFTLVTTDEMIRGDKLTAGFVAPFNKELRTALCGVLADGFIKAGIRWNPCSPEEYEAAPEYARSIRDKKINGKAKKDVPCLLKEISCPYCKMYIDYKRRLSYSENTVEEVRKAGAKAQAVEWKDAKAAHRDRAAKRYMVKMFLADLYAAWRPLHGLPVRVPYQEQYLGHKHEERKVA